MTNDGDQPTSVSSIGMWTLIDPDHRSADMTISGDERGSLDADPGPEDTFTYDEAYAAW